MNEIIKTEIKIEMFDNAAMTDSRNIADVFGKHHAHVLRDIEGFRHLSNFGEMFIEGAMPDSYGRNQKIFHINRDGFSLLAMGFTGKEALRWKVQYIKAFNEMESKLMSPEYIMAKALKIADETINGLRVENAKLIEENAIMAPKAEYFDDLVDRNLLTSFRDTAKELKIGEKAFIQFLLNNKYIYRDQRNKLKPYADKNVGLFELKEFNARHNDHSGLQTLITPKGRETFRLLIGASK